MGQAHDWLPALEASIPEYARRLEASGSPGRFRVCLRGATPLGRRVALGFSCLALKLYSMLGLWGSLDANRREGWIQFVRGFQLDNDADVHPVFRGAFVDPAVVYDARTYGRYPRQLLYDAYSGLRRPREFLRDRVMARRPTLRERVVAAETKQALASLRQVGCEAREPYRGFPLDADRLWVELEQLDWSRPWQAGGQAAAMAMFVAVEAPRVLDPALARELASACIGWFDEIVDAETGAYFSGSVPDHAQLVNGAMKVLTALDWLDVPIHYPRRLIDTCLRQVPGPDACHLVDATYVLYRSAKQTPHRRVEVRAYCRLLLDRIRRHYNPDGGFSYGVGRSQTGYYGVQITRGLAESDLHGTVLLAWALAMIAELLELDRPAWRVIKP
jgi:hypothetical protein